MRFLENRIHQNSRKGFTAMEIAMVAAILAMFALLVMPQFKDQVEKARVTATKADLESFMKAEILAKAETGFYLRLEDLDNNADNWSTAMQTNGVTNEVPFYRYSFNVDPTQAANRPVMTAAQRTAFGKLFKGAYAIMPKTMMYSELRNTTQNPISMYILRSLTGNPLSPIQDFATGGGGEYDSLFNKYPVDPWGNPYLFYPATGETGTEATTFLDNLIVSLGPDGIPGAMADGNNATYYIRNKTTGWLGIGTTNTSSDDIMLSF